MAAGRQLNRVEMFEAAQWLGDRPQTVLPYHGLVTGRCEAWIAGELPEPRALLVRTHYVPTEPFGFGRDAALLISMLLETRGWTCINVGDGLMESAAAAIVAQTGKNVKRFGDLYNVLVQPSATFNDPSVRFLTREDEEILSNAPRPVSPGNPKLTPLILSEGLCAAAIIDGQIVSRAFAYAVTPNGRLISFIESHTRVLEREFLNGTARFEIRVGRQTLEDLKRNEGVTFLRK